MLTKWGYPQGLFKKPSKEDLLMELFYLQNKETTNEQQ